MSILFPLLFIVLGIIFGSLVSIYIISLMMKSKLSPWLKEKLSTWKYNLVMVVIILVVLCALIGALIFSFYMNKIEKVTEKSCKLNEFLEKYITKLTNNEDIDANIRIKLRDIINVLLYNNDDSKLITYREGKRFEKRVGTIIKSIGPEISSTNTTNCTDIFYLASMLAPSYTFLGMLNNKICRYISSKKVNVNVNKDTIDPNSNLVLALTKIKGLEEYYSKKKARMISDSDYINIPKRIKEALVISERIPEAIN